MSRERIENYAKQAVEFLDKELKACTELPTIDLFKMMSGIVLGISFRVTRILYLLYFY